MKKSKRRTNSSRRSLDAVSAGSGPVAVVILAAGLGKRMKSSLPKVLHEIGGQPLLLHTLDRVMEATPGAEVAVITGHGREQVEARASRHPLHAEGRLHFIVQPEQRGTGDAARCAMESDWGRSVEKRGLPVLVLPGDMPLLTTELVRELVRPMPRAAKLRLLTTELPDPTGYGRVVRRGKRVLRIVEQKDATPRERAIREVALSTYLFEPAFLSASLKTLSNRNAQGEFYLTDLIEKAAKTASGVEPLLWANPEDLLGINDLWELAQAGRIMNARKLRQLARDGVRVLDPESIRVEESVEVEPGAILHPRVILAGSTKISAGAEIGPGCVLRNMVVGAGAHLKAGTVAEDSVVDSEAQVGPYAHLRPGSHVGAKAKIGNFVELKKTRIGAGTSVAHLSYLGDAEVGERVNIGCGFVTCNFDGRVIDGERKHRTWIEDDVFLGSDCQTVAPVRIGRGAYVASGSTITENVEPEALAIARSRQVNKPGYARKLRSKD